MLKLPKSLETEKDIYIRFQSFIDKHTEPVWHGAQSGVISVPFSESVIKSLAFARRCGNLRGGFENIETYLQTEGAGIAAIQKTSVKNISHRISRLFLFSDDGSERFYRHCEKLLKRYENRLLGVKLNVSSTKLGESFFGQDRSVKAVLVTRQEFVARVLLSLMETADHNQKS